MPKASIPSPCPASKMIGSGEVALAAANWRAGVHQNNFLFLGPNNTKQHQIRPNNTESRKVLKCGMYFARAKFVTRLERINDFRTLFILFVSVSSSCWPFCFWQRAL